MLFRVDNKAIYSTPTVFVHACILADILMLLCVIDNASVISCIQCAILGIIIGV